MNEPRPNWIKPEPLGAFSRPPWNFCLIALGSLLAAFGFSALAEPQGFVAGGVYGLGLWTFYLSGKGSPAWWYFLFNLPIFLAAWFLVSRRFFVLSLFGMAALTLAAEFIRIRPPISDPMLAAAAAGLCIGAGVGVTFRALGSTGGVDIIAIILHQRWNIPVGKVGFYFNVLVFLLSFASVKTDLVLYSIVLNLVASVTTDRVMGMFNQRKAVLVVSDKPEAIADAVLNRLDRGATYLAGRGAYSGAKRELVLTVVDNYQLKQLEKIIFEIDPNAFTVEIDTFNVLGEGFSRRTTF